MNENKIKVLYHKNCPDGFSSAWVAWTVFGDQADYIPAVHEIKSPDIKDSDLYFLDIVYSKKIMNELIEINNKVIVIDHHESAKETVESIPGSTYGEDNSAAVLTWKYFYPNKEVPRFLKHIEDVDLWKWEMDKSEEFIAFLTLKDMEFNVWSELVEDFEDSEKARKYFKKGESILKHKKYLTDSAVSKASLVEFEGYEVLASNSSLLKSDIGARLYEKHPPFSIIWYKGNGILKISMRSNGDVDVKEIAKKYGGGGHRQSASFKLDINDDLPFKFLDKNNLEK